MEKVQSNGVSCSVCHREVPRADALSVEGQEYLYYFCGQGCYILWKQELDVPADRQQADRRQV